MTSLDGYEMDWHIGHAAELHLWHLTQNACDVFEMSISNYIITRARPEQRERLRWLAVPTFLMKAAMWLDFYVHKDSGIHTFASNPTIWRGANGWCPGSRVAAQRPAALHGI